MTKSYLTQTQRNTLVWHWMPSCACRHTSRKNAKSWDHNTRKCIDSWEDERPFRYTISWCCTNKYWSLWGPTAYSCGDPRNRATLTSFNDFKTRYLEIYLMYLGISETPTSIGTFKWRWLRMKLESSLRSMKKGFSTMLMSKRSSCSITVNWCEGL